MIGDPATGAMRRILDRLTPARGASVDADIQASAVSWAAQDGTGQVSAKVDDVVRSSGAIVVAGWCSDGTLLRLRVGDSPLQTLSFQTPRPDVAAYLGAAEGTALGRVLVGLPDQPGPLFLEAIDGVGGVLATFPLKRESPGLEGGMRRLMEPAAAAMLAERKCPPSLLRAIEDATTDASAMPTSAVGMLDDVRVLDGGGAAVAKGWLVDPTQGGSWLETDSGRRFPLGDGERVRRDDVIAEARRAGGHPDAHAGFLIALDGVKAGESVRLVVDEDGAAPRTLSSAVCADWGRDPVAASRWLFDVSTPIHDFSRRVRRVDLPVLGAALEARGARWPAPRRNETLGTPPDAPEVSIIVPLFARLDFVEHQLMEFARDPWLLAHAEIIYVVDDPDLVEPLSAKAAQLHQLWSVPFRWVWGGLNRGFAGANNLGAEHGSAPRFLFLNSDVIPGAPGWLETLVTALDADPALAAVGPQLLFADGSIQHAGMAFRWRPDLRIWTNQHPLSGLETDMDPRDSTTRVPAITGACLLVHRDAFDAVGRWNTGYLVGDFEDSELCLALRRLGRQIGYCPQATLTHLERQSMPATGAGDYRMRVVVFNAVRHETRWGDALAREAGDVE